MLLLPTHGVLGTSFKVAPCDTNHKMPPNNIHGDFIEKVKILDYSLEAI